MIYELIVANLMSPLILSFVLGAAAGFARSDLTIPEAVGKAIAVYLMFAIGLKGGVAAASSELSLTFALTLMAGVMLSFGLPFLAFLALRRLVGLGSVEAASVAAHYGSISVVTFVTASELLRSQGIPFEGYLVAVLALMETPAIISGIWLARRGREGRGGFDGDVLREIFLNGSVVLLSGGFLIGLVSGPAAAEKVMPFFKTPFSGVLCLFLLDMGLVAARRFSSGRTLSPRLLGFGVVMPLVGAGLGVGTGAIVGLSLGGATLLGVLAASASYIAVPAAMRLALPQANPAVSLTLSLAVTFPFNVVLGIPLYSALARVLYGV